MWCNLKVDGSDSFCYNAISEGISSLSDYGLLTHLILSDVEYSIDMLILPMLISSTNNINSTGDMALRNFLTLLSRNEHFNFMMHFGDLLLQKVCLDCGDNAKKIIKNLFSNYSAEIKLPKSHLLDDNQLFLYHTLMSPELQKYSIEDLCSYKLFDVLQNAATLSNSEISSELNGSILTDIIFHKTLLPLVWNLGASDSVLLKRTKIALGLLCFVGVGLAWKKKSQSIEILSEHVATILPKHFLFLITNLIQLNWNDQTSNYSENAVRSLHSLICILRQTDICKFLPKVIRHLNIAVVL
jgi:hypothetical protein